MQIRAMRDLRHLPASGPSPNLPATEPLGTEGGLEDHKPARHREG
jgi:hypothetical protein